MSFLATGDAVEVEGTGAAESVGASVAGLGFGGDGAAERRGAAAMEEDGAGASREEGGFDGAGLRDEAAAEEDTSGLCARFRCAAMEDEDVAGLGKICAIAGDDMVERADVGMNAKLAKKPEKTA